MNGQMGFGEGDDDTPTRQCPITGVHEGHMVAGFLEQSYWCPGVAPERAAHARRTDPSTSHEAAASFTPRALTENELAVLRVLGAVHPAADEEWMACYIGGDVPEQSPSGLRTRRASLVEQGLVTQVGETKIRNRRCILWGLTIAGVAKLRSL